MQQAKTTSTSIGNDQKGSAPNTRKCFFQNPKTILNASAERRMAKIEYSLSFLGGLSLNSFKW